jgi:hypothetical protein
MMETVSTPETSVYSNDTTQRYIPEGSHIHIRRRENHKSRISTVLIIFSQEALIKRLGPNAHPFTMEVTPLAPPSVQLVPAKEYSGAPIGTSYDVRAYAGTLQL